MSDTRLVRSNQADFGLCGVLVWAVCVTDCYAQAPVNDLCSGAIDIPHDPAGSGFGSSGGALLLGDTTNATVDTGSPGGCDVVLEPNVAPGVWFKLTGMGNFVRLSTDVPETLFDTVITVYCSDNAVDPCANLACLTANNDIDFSIGLRNSELEFCAQLGKGYYILIHGSSSASLGAFGLLAEEVRDGSNQLIPCAEVQDCSFECVFEIPAGALDELTDFGALSEVCDETNINGNNNGCDGPPNAQGNWQGMFPKIHVGDVVTGTLWSSGGIRDSDQYLFENVLASATFGLVDYSWASESPIQVRPHYLSKNFFLCSPSGTFFPWVTRTSYCGETENVRQVVDLFSQTDNDGRLWGEPGHVKSMVFEIESLILSPTGGLPCGVRNRYWFRINEVVADSDCQPPPDPLGVTTTDNPANPLVGDVTFRDWDLEEIQPVFGGVCGSSCQNDPGDARTDVLAGESCGLEPNPRQLRGCSEILPLDGDFMLLRPDVPIVGHLNASITLSSFGGDLVDWYMFEIGSRRIVQLSIQSGVPFFVALGDDCSAQNALLPTSGLLSWTRGTCASTASQFDDFGVLEPGRYVIRVLRGDLVGDSIARFWTTLCATALDGFSEYILQVSTDIAPQCEGDADGSGTVNFGDITNILGNWLSDYSTTGGTGAGDGNGDGVVNFGDITSALGNWGVVCP